MSTATPELPKQYRPADHEARIWSLWQASKAFHADPERVLSGQAPAYSVVIPPPNVTDRLHLGHALNNTLQDILVRTHRMRGYETLWMPGTDHAGIATQAVVERRVMKEEKKRRTDFSRDDFIKKIQAFKDEYEAVITGQLKAMGCSCDWDRQRFTMDEQCARAVREAFFRLFKDGLIYRGKRLVNWDPALQTAVADDECYDEEVDSSFWYLRYPLTAPVRLADGTTIEHVTVATTRPETYLGDTAVAMNPADPRASALVGKSVRLPLLGRVIPIIADPYVVLPKSMARNEEEANDPKAEFATGFLKVTPAHDTNDWEIGQRHKLPAINMMSPDGRVSDKHGLTDINQASPFVGLKMEEARKAVVKKFEEMGHLQATRPYRQSKKFSDRSKAVIEPYLSDQWYVRVTDPRMAKAANEAIGASSGGPPLRGGLGSPALPKAAAHTVLDRCPYPPFAPAGFAGKDPYPPGQASPAMVKTQRYLPHIEIEGATYFVTWRTAGDIQLSAQERDLALDALLHHNGERIDLFAACIMSNHVHCVVRCLEGTTLSSWLAGVKRFSARGINDGRGVQGHVWQDESFDHVVRDEGFLAEFVQYIAENPVEAGAASKPSEYPWTFVSEGTLVALARTMEPEGARMPASERRATQSDLIFHPSRYAKTYQQWHEGIRDWCISRQLWWGHRIPVWALTPQTGPGSGCRFIDEPKAFFRDLRAAFQEIAARIGAPGSIEIQDGGWVGDTRTYYICTNSSVTADVIERIRKALDEHSIDHKPGQALPQNELDSIALAGWDLLHAVVAKIYPQDPDVLDTWFSSALWPMSTMGWPDNTPLLRAFNPTSTLSTAREIITLWVSRMVMFNRYFMPTDWPNAGPLDAEHHGQGMGPVPFRDVFIHAVVQDGEGRKMSKSLGNGVDPLDIIASHGTDALRYTICQMATNTQDVRMPVTRDPATGKNTSPKFDAGRNFCNKLWNAARFAISIVSKSPAGPVADPKTLSLPDRWMLSRLAAAVEQIDRAIADFEFSVYAQAVYDLMWRDFCDWYLEAIKPTVANDPQQRAVLAHVLQSIVRLLHPIAPFVTEAIWETLSTLSPATVAGIRLDPPRKSNLLCTAGWPDVSASLRDGDAEARFERMRALVTAIREVRAQQAVNDKRKITLHAPDAVITQVMGSCPGLVEALAGLEKATPGAPSGDSSAFTYEAHTLRLSNLADALDADAEKARLTKQITDLDKTIATLEGRLANPGYAERAPAAMVQQTRDQLAKAKAERDAAQAALRSLESKA